MAWWNDEYDGTGASKPKKTPERGRNEETDARLRRLGLDPMKSKTWYGDGSIYNPGADANTPDGKWRKAASGDLVEGEELQSLIDYFGPNGGFSGKVFGQGTGANGDVVPDMAQFDAGVMNQGAGGGNPFDDPMSPLYGMNPNNVPTTPEEVMEWLQQQEYAGGPVKPMFSMIPPSGVQTRETESGTTTPDGINADWHESNQARVARIKSSIHNTGMSEGGLDDAIASNVIPGVVDGVDFIPFWQYAFKPGGMTAEEKGRMDNMVTAQIESIMGELLEKRPDPADYNNLATPADKAAFAGAMEAYKVHVASASEVLEELRNTADNIWLFSLGQRQLATDESKNYTGSQALAFYETVAKGLGLDGSFVHLITGRSVEDVNSIFGAILDGVRVNNASDQWTQEFEQRKFEFSQNYELALRELGIREDANSTAYYQAETARMELDWRIRFAEDEKAAASQLAVALNPLLVKMGFPAGMLEKLKFMSSADLLSLLSLMSQRFGQQRQMGHDVFRSPFSPQVV